MLWALFCASPLLSLNLGERRELSPFCGAESSQRSEGWSYLLIVEHGRVNVGERRCSLESGFELWPSDIISQVGQIIVPV